MPSIFSKAPVLGLAFVSVVQRLQQSEVLQSGKQLTPSEAQAIQNISAETSKLRRRAKLGGAVSKNKIATGRSRWRFFS